MSMLGIQSANLVFEVSSYERTGLLDLICSVYTAEMEKEKGCIYLRTAKIG